MAKKESNTKGNIYLVLNLILAIVTMGLVSALISNIVAGNERGTILFLILSLISQILFQVLVFIVKDNKKDRIRIVTVGGLYLVALILAFNASKEHYVLFFVINTIVLIALAVNQFMQIGKKEGKLGVTTNILLGIVLVGLAIATITDIVKEEALYCNIVVAISLLIISVKKILFPTLKLEKVKLLFNILVKTHTIDIIICLFAFMVAFSFILPRIEPNITDFEDSIWYCFTVVTTIGFGDKVAETGAGRLLTVVLGVYGIVVVAILTSVIVNFYNEVTAKEKAGEFIE